MREFERNCCATYGIPKTRLLVNRCCCLKIYAIDFVRDTKNKTAKNTPKKTFTLF